MSPCASAASPAAVGVVPLRGAPVRQPDLGGGSIHRHPEGGVVAGSSGRGWHSGGGRPRARRYGKCSCGVARSPRETALRALRGCALQQPPACTAGHGGCHFRHVPTVPRRRPAVAPQDPRHRRRSFRVGDRSGGARSRCAERWLRVIALAVPARWRDAAPPHAPAGAGQFAPLVAGWSLPRVPALGRRGHAGPPAHPRWRRGASLRPPARRAVDGALDARTAASCW
jgi:hypothetical protein